MHEQFEEVVDALDGNPVDLTCTFPTPVGTAAVSSEDKERGASGFTLTATTSPPR